MRRTHLVELLAVSLGLLALWASFHTWRSYVASESDFSIPAPPPFESLPVARPEPVAGEEPDFVAAPAELAAPQLDARGLPRGWAVRTGSFADPEAARQAVAALLARNLPAFSREVGQGGALSYEVLVGPKLDPRQARALQAQLAALGAAELVEYQPALGGSLPR